MQQFTANVPGQRRGNSVSDEQFKAFTEEFKAAIKDSLDAQFQAAEKQVLEAIKPLAEKVAELEKAQGGMTVHSRADDGFWDSYDLNAAIEEGQGGSQNQQPHQKRASNSDSSDYWENYDMNAHLEDE